MRRLVCVSNRISLPRRGAAPGGLAVGVLAALQHTGGVWFGWSGETSDKPDPRARDRHARQHPVRHHRSEAGASSTRYYNGYCNGTLWPLFHYFPDALHARAARSTRRIRRVNAQFARQLLKLLQPGRCRLGARLSPDPAGRAICAQLGFRRAHRLLPAHSVSASAGAAAAAELRGAGARSVSVRPASASRRTTIVHSFLSCLEAPEGFRADTAA